LTRRLERAAALLRSTDRSVADICITVGLRSWLVYLARRIDGLPVGLLARAGAR
jgi:hypothetical protein